MISRDICDYVISTDIISKFLISTIPHDQQGFQVKSGKPYDQQ